MHDQAMLDARVEVAMGIISTGINPDDLSNELDTTQKGFDQVDGADMSFNNEYEWEPRCVLLIACVIIRCALMTLLIMVCIAVGDVCLPINCILEDAPIAKTIEFPDDVVFVDGDWNKNSAVLEQKDLFGAVSVFVADDVVPNSEVLKVAETEIVEGEFVVDFPATDADGKNEVPPQGGD